MASSVASLLAKATGSHWTLIRYSRMLGKGAIFLSAGRRPLFFKCGINIANKLSYCVAVGKK
ncbi:hypothetical protein D2V08_13035 [Flagellimonas lutimaris]|uniref:Uncharacterized protein n=1 Tax=Flagellimonas lutimaris TaxID=475082 RepID=A0A3A1N462_9FLAO|nr:hypothetical protein D2V08_13035 [Allomuricauda lutimaris]